MRLRKRTIEKPIHRCITLPEDFYYGLVEAAAHEAIAKQKDVFWTDMARTAIAKYLKSRVAKTVKVSK